MIKWVRTVTLGDKPVLTMVQMGDLLDKAPQMDGVFCRLVFLHPDGKITTRLALRNTVKKIRDLTKMTGTHLVPGLTFEEGLAVHAAPWLPKEPESSEKQATVSVHDLVATAITPPSHEIGKVYHWPSQLLLHSYADALSEVGAYTEFRFEGGGLMLAFKTYDGALVMKHLPVFETKLVLKPTSTWKVPEMTLIAPGVGEFKLVVF